MELPDFVDLRRPRWSALESLLDKAEGGGLAKLSLEDARQLSKLYRSASSDLLWVRAHGDSADVGGFLNDLVGRAYAITHPGKRMRFSDIGAFLRRGFPDLLNRELKMFLASWLVFAAGGAFGYLGMMADKDAAAYIVIDYHLKTDPTERAKEEAKAEGASVEGQAAFSSMLMTHNIGVAFFCFALGLTVGVGTVLMLFVNGIFLGSLAQVYAAKGLAGWFWAWILPHGIPEITAICLAATAGLVLARGQVAPLGLTRRQALRRESGTAIRLLMGTLALFVLAGIIEGTISQIHPPRLPVWVKIGFALIVGSGVYAYLLSGSWRAARQSS